MDRRGRRRTIRAHQIDLRIELSIPPPADRGHVGPWQAAGAADEFQRLPDHGFDRPSSPAGPTTLDDRERRRRTTAAGLLSGGPQNREVQTKVAVGDAIEAWLARSSRQGLVHS